MTELHTKLILTNFLDDKYEYRKRFNLVELEKSLADLKSQDIVLIKLEDSRAGKMIREYYMYYMLLKHESSQQTTTASQAAAKNKADFALHIFEFLVRSTWDLKEYQYGGNFTVTKGWNLAWSPITP